LETYTLESIIDGCKTGNRKAQNALYQKYSSELLTICRRYTRNPDEADDIFIEAFMKILQNISTYKGAGSFDGWMKRIVINQALNYYRKNKKLPFLMISMRLTKPMSLTLMNIVPVDFQLLLQKNY